MSTPRTPALDSALLIIEILQRIPRRRFTTSTHIQEQLANASYHVTLRTVQRHLDAIIGRFPIECDARSKPFGYRWNDGAEGLNLPLLTPSEALLLQLSRSELVGLLPAKTLKSLAPLFASARTQLDTTPTPQAERRWLTKVRRIPESQPLIAPKISPGVFEAVSDALYNERKLDIRYRNAQGRSKQATVWPLGLAQQGVRPYLVCRFEGFDNERILALPRILQAQVSSASFPYPADFDLACYDGGGHFGISHEQRVRLSFVIDKPSGQHLVESPLSTDQSIVEHDTTLAITATVIDTELLHRWLRGWGDKLTGLVISPCQEPGRNFAKKT